jgi:GDP-mannose 6-dehydrogenase
MRLSVFGLGYVGCVSAACFARGGHQVWGVDISQTKVDLINSGNSPVAETGVADLIRAGVAEGNLRATSDSAAAVRASEMSLICVGTPSSGNGCLDLGHIKHVCEQIGSALRDKAERHTVVVRSTMLPGSIESVVVPALETSSGMSFRRDFDVCINPEFMREGSSLEDFYAPPFTLIGTDDENVAARVRPLYASIDAPVLVVGVKTAEMVKYACNCFHAVKICFANEIGNVCKELNIDSHKVMEIFCRDTKLNLSSEYLKPGFAFGGSCLPKDLRAITHQAKEMGLDVPLLSAVLHSNRLQVERAAEMVQRTAKTRIGLLGISFKPGTDDLRESPTVMLIEELISRGMQVSVYDPEISLDRIFGANVAYIERAIPNISQLMRTSIDQLLADTEVVVVSKKVDDFRGIETKLRADQVLIDLVRLLDRETGASYQGICW